MLQVQIYRTHHEHLTNILSLFVQLSLSFRANFADRSISVLCKNVTSLAHPILRLDFIRSLKFALILFQQ